MKTWTLLLSAIFLVLSAACSKTADSRMESGVPAATQAVQDLDGDDAGNSPGPAEAAPNPIEAAPTEVAPTQKEIKSTDCLGGEISPIGQSIAEDYQAASYEQVMDWFCDGAEFEDILVALETEELTDASADEMLQMLADDFTWDDIWLILGLTD